MGDETLGRNTDPSLAQIAEDVRYLADRARREDEEARRQLELRAEREREGARRAARSYELECRKAVRDSQRRDYRAQVRQRFEAIYGSRATRRRSGDFEWKLRCGPYALAWDAWAFGLTDLEPTP